MATNTMMSPMSLGSQFILDVDQPIANGASNAAEESIDEKDDKSSSLSELGERERHDDPEEPFDDNSEANDTEAETERLEESPQKVRKHQNVVLTPKNRTDPGHQISSTLPSLSEVLIDDGPHLDVDKMEATSEISSPADSGGDDRRPLSASPVSSRKRKRPSFDRNSLSDQGSPRKSSSKASKMIRTTSTGALFDDRASIDSAEEDEPELSFGKAKGLVVEARSRDSSDSATPEADSHNGKRELDTINMETRDNDTPQAESPGRLVDDQDMMGSMMEENENQEVEDIRQADNTGKSEELLSQKRAALDSLNAMEKCFAKLRDKLFDERLAQCNEELAMLESAIPTHPELLAMKDVVDQRLDQKVQYEHSLLKFKLQTLQRESVANKAQAHAQYLQTVREIRDSHLEELNKDVYQLQRERRNVEADVPDYIFSFNPRRSQQITHQTAYNMEVSILSGIAKHVGFPAAPDLPQARPKEIEDDLRSMGIPQSTNNHASILRASSSFAQRRQTPDEHFLEQNPWANPQHPSHHQQRQQLPRQLSALSRTVTPSVGQRRVIDLTEPPSFGSSAHRGPPPNMNVLAKSAPTPAEASKAAQPSQTSTRNGVLDETPSRTPLNIPEIATNHNELAQARNSEQTTTPSLPRATSQDNPNIGSLPKPLPFLHTSGSASTPTPRTSTPGRYTVIKAENPLQGGRQSSMPRYHTPPVGTAGENGFVGHRAM